MTAYSVGFQWSVTGGLSGTYTYSRNISIRAGSYPVRLLQLEAFGLVDSGGSPFGYASTGITAAFYRYEVATHSGGVSLTPAALREGAAPASATVRHQTTAYNASGPSWTNGTAVTLTGTQKLLRTIPLASAVANPISPVSETTINPGSAFNIVGVTAPYPAYFMYWVLWFDEEHLQRST